MTDDANGAPKPPKPNPVRSPSHPDYAKHHPHAGQGKGAGGGRKLGEPQPRHHRTGRANSTAKMVASRAAAVLAQELANKKALPLNTMTQIMQWHMARFKGAVKMLDEFERSQAALPIDQRNEADRKLFEQAARDWSQSAYIAAHKCAPYMHASLSRISQLPLDPSAVQAGNVPTDLVEIGRELSFALVLAERARQQMPPTIEALPAGALPVDPEQPETVN